MDNIIDLVIDIVGGVLRRPMTSHLYSRLFHFGDFLFTQTHQGKGLPLRIFCLLIRCLMSSALFWAALYFGEVAFAPKRFSFVWFLMVLLPSGLGLFFLCHAICIVFPNFLQRKP